MTLNLASNSGLSGNKGSKVVSGIGSGVSDSYWNVLTLTPGGSTVELSWPTAGGSPTSYELDIDGTIIDVGNNTSYTASQVSIGNTYSFKVRPVYGRNVGGWSYFKTGGPTGFNSATGGTISTVSNYNGTGETWKVHQFTSSSNFVVTESYGLFDFDILVVGGGGGGGGTNGVGGRGGDGAFSSKQTHSLSAGSYSITVGGGGGAGCDRSWGGGGGQSKFGVLMTANGGGGGAENGNGAGTSRATTYTITGSSLTVGYGGGGPSPQAQGGTNSAAGSGGGGARASGVQCGASGRSGLVVVAYRVG